MNPAPQKRKANLTAKQSAFCQEYLVDLNATQAAIRAGYSERTARQAGAENMAKPVIQVEVKRLMDERAQRVEVTADTVLAELMKLALVDIGQAFNNDGSLKPLHEMPEGMRRAIAGVDVFEEFEGRGEDRQQIGFTKKLRLWDKTRALEMLGRHLKLFTDKTEVTGKDGEPIGGLHLPTAEEVLEWTNRFVAGWEDYRDPEGNAVSFDTESAVKLAYVAGEYAAGRGGGKLDPEKMGAGFAMCASVQANI